jgi:hypothetical protein
MVAAACSYLHDKYIRWHNILPVGSYWNWHRNHFAV